MHCWQVQRSGTYTAFCTLKYLCAENDKRPLLRVCLKKISNFCSVQVRESQHSRRIFQPLHYKYKNEKGVTLEF